jgi:hypothetical protein
MRTRIKIVLGSKQKILLKDITYNPNIELCDFGISDDDILDENCEEEDEYDDDDFEVMVDILQVTSLMNESIFVLILFYILTDVLFILKNDGEKI